MKPRIEAIGVGKRWADRSGLLPTSFTAMPGELVVVRGRSGSGKSTLLGIIAALCEPDEGIVLRDGVPMPPTAPPWSDLTLVPQTLALAVELTISENVRDAKPEVTAEDLGRLLASLDLESVADSLPTAASMGEQQRCAVARALITAPRLLLADEPTSHQDSVHADAVLRCLWASTERGAAVLIATHDPELTKLASVVVDLETD